MRRRTSILRVSMHCFALSLHPHMRMSSTSRYASTIICSYCVYVRVALIFQICAITLFAVYFGAKLLTYSNRICADTARVGACCDLHMHSNLVQFYQTIIVQSTLLKHNFRTEVRDFTGSNKVLSAQSVVRRLLFWRYHAQNVLQ